MKLLASILLLCGAVFNSGSQEVWSPPYSDAIHYMLSGVWDENHAGPPPDGRMRSVSWGTVKIWPGYSRLIDLKGRPPFLEMLGAYFEIVSIERVSDDLLKMNFVDPYSKEALGYFLVYLVDRGGIRFEQHLVKERVFDLSFGSPVYRHYDPSQNLK